VIDSASFAPATDWKDVTPHATNSLPDGVADYLYVGGAGDVSFVTSKGTTITRAVPAGSYVWCKVSAVRVSGTTATQITACYTKRK